MNKISRYILAAMLGIISVSAAAQIRGTVRSRSGELLTGAGIYWAGTSSGTTSDAEGRFSIDRNASSNMLAISYIGFRSDTIQVNASIAELDIVLDESEKMQEVTVTGRRPGIVKAHSADNTIQITATELTRAACCNLGESFTTNPSVDVSYDDAATGARQIKLLGLSGSYVQMLTETIPNYRGAASPYSLGYVPGPWMQSIQVSKGSASVKNGYESITGQINVEFLKPQAEEAIHVNLYGDSKSRIEANADANIHLTGKLSTSLLIHYEDNYGHHDENGDGFLDQPKVRQLHVQNRWARISDRHIFQASVKALDEKREGGQVHGPFSIGMDTRRYEAFVKNAYIIDPDRNMNVALILSGNLHSLDATYGYKVYDVDQTNLYATLMFESDFCEIHNLSTGINVNYDGYSQDWRLTHDPQGALTHGDENETAAGAYAQYTLDLDGKLILMAGLRADYSTLHGAFITPRAHVRYAPADWFSIRASAGKGYRTVHPLAEFNYLMGSGRQLIIDVPQQEEAWNYGLSAAFDIPLFGKTLNLNAEYYYTDFIHQTIIDYESSPGELRIANLEGDSWSHTFQVDATYPLFKGMNLTAAYRLNDVKTTYAGQLMDKPLTSRYKGLVTASYETPLGIWQFDVTLQMNGGGRMPTPYTLPDGTPSWDSTFPAYNQLNAQITRWFRRWSIYIGGENLTGFRQQTTIIGADDPWSSTFDPTMVWGPVHGAMFYAGIRLNLVKY